MKKLLLLFAFAAILAVLVWGYLRKNTPPSVNFARVARETLVSTLPTNGRVEPIDWQSVRAEAAGLVNRVDAVDGRAITRGAVIAVLTGPALQSEIDSALAKASEARANLASLETGMKPADATEIENSLARARLDLTQAQTERDTLDRLVQKNAATKAELAAASNRVQQAQLAVTGLEKRKAAATVTPPELAAARARIEAADIAVNLARKQAALAEIHAPISGTVYDLAVRPGAYVHPGDPIANIGNLDRLRIRVYIDEPELGRVQQGQPVTITWQALPGKQWDGTVERKPASIETLGTRQVGEVICTIENPGHQLIPGTNVDALIRTGVAENALAVPKEALRHDAAGDYVLRLNGDTVERRNVRTGSSSVTRIQVADGLAEGDSVALPTESPLQSGDRVTPAAEPKK